MEQSLGAQGCYVEDFKQTRTRPRAKRCRLWMGTNYLAGLLLAGGSGNINAAAVLNEKSYPVEQRVTAEKQNNFSRWRIPKKS